LLEKIAKTRMPVVITRGRLVFEEIGHLEAQLRGVYAKRSLPEGHPLTVDDVYLAIPSSEGATLKPRIDKWRNSAEGR
jgi:hypothetical protein